VFGQEEMQAYTHALAQAAQKTLTFQEVVKVSGKRPKPKRCGR
jgi:hypothetical protein